MDEFEEFWRQYPRKTGKGDARKAWLKQVKTEEVHAKIFAALEKLRHCTQWNRDGGQFIPYPATWLNRDGWDDEPEPQTLERTSANAWLAVRRAIQQGRMATITDPRTLAAIERMGGWSGLAEMRTDQAPFRQREFEAAYGVGV